jgi:cysteine desulfurase
LSLASSLTLLSLSGRFTTEAEVDRTVALCVKHVTRLREMSPLWEMFQEGVDISSIKWAA